MSKRSTIWAVVYAIASGMFWIPLAHWLNLIGPMMLDDGPAVNRTLAWTGGALLLYVALSAWFFRWLVSGDKVF